MNAAKLLDSRRFTTLMDDLVTTWKKRGSTDEDKAFRLQVVLDCLDGMGGAPVDPPEPAATVKGQGIRNPPPPLPQNMDPLAPSLEFIKEIEPVVMRTPMNPEGLRMVNFPTNNVDPNMVATALGENSKWFIDASETPISMVNGQWVVPCRVRG